MSKMIYHPDESTPGASIGLSSDASLGIYKNLAVIMASGDPAWPRVAAILEPHLRNGQTGLSVWPVGSDIHVAAVPDLTAVLGAVTGLIWDDAVDSVLILGNSQLFPAGLGIFLDADVRERLYSIPAPVLIAGPPRDDPDFAAIDWEGMRTPEQAAASIARTVARYPTILERAAHRNGKQ